MPKWSYAHVLPYFKKMETFEKGGNEYRGATGPLHVHQCRAENPLYEAFLAAGRISACRSAPTKTASSRRASTAPKPRFATASARARQLPICVRPRAAQISPS
ncbi:hypothetical protein G3A56_27955 (plasmid) [Rhizobium oryzihabitans]|uniref:Uncharacterized protein n=1 Tax=Rhizobium oryzihabitans TaxID=2267833 RepID=A0A7L5BRQ8_9HYPH|nr:hypothetical protein G3A56_27955 [Rhizobium oryzihabitans]